MKILAKTLCILILLTAAAAGQERQTPPVEFQKIEENLYLITGGRGANGGLFIGETGVLVIDAKQTAESAGEVLSKIAALTDKPVKYLVNTHSDGDHVTGNRFFPETVTFIAHENCRKEFFISRSGGESEWKNPALAPFVPGITFNDRMDIRLGEKRIELHYFGVGHTTGDAVVYFPEEKTAFIGDQIFIGRPQLIHSYKGGNSFEHVKTLSKMLDALDVERFCSGHANVLGREDIRNHIALMRGIQEKVGKLIETGKTLEQITAEFEENQSRLIESIHAEVLAGKNK